MDNKKIIVCFTTAMKGNELNAQTMKHMKHSFLIFSLCPFMPIANEGSKLALGQQCLYKLTHFSKEHN